jgi:hypothetical protein
MREALDWSAWPNEEYLRQDLGSNFARLVERNGRQSFGFPHQGAKKMHLVCRTAERSSADETGFLSRGRAISSTCCKRAPKSCGWAADRGHSVV